MTKPHNLSGKAITERLRRNPKECPACHKAKIKVRTDFHENTARDEDLLIKHCSCGECGFAWEESYRISLYEAIPKDFIYRQIGNKKTGIA